MFDKAEEVTPSTKYTNVGWSCEIVKTLTEWLTWLGLIRFCEANPIIVDMTMVGCGSPSSKELIMGSLESSPFYSTFTGIHYFDFWGVFDVCS